MIGSLGYLGFGVSDRAAWESFATGVLGLMSVVGPGDTRRYRCDEFAWRIAVEEGTDDLAYVGYEVADESTLVALTARLRDAGVAVAQADATRCEYRGVLGLASCSDPDGLTIELFYGPTQRHDQPFTSPVGVTGFNTAAQGLGHVVLATPDIGRARAFYVDLLGFRLSDVITMRPAPGIALDLEFFHCNARHHTLALVPAPAAKRLHHFMLEAATLDDVGFALDRVMADGATVTQSLGRHTNDGMVSFYVRTPSGFEVEFGWGGVPVDGTTWRVTRHDRMSSWGHGRPSRAGA